AEAARRSLMSYQRAEESAADISALAYLESTGQSAKGMLKTFQRFVSALSLSGTRVDPYSVSHPMPRERIANLTERAEKSRFYEATDPAALQLRHDMMRAKIAAFTGGQNATSRMFRNSANALPGQYGDAISTYLYGNPAAALKKVDALLKKQPQNPYFIELRGDVLMKANKAADAADAYARAIKLDPSRSGLIQASYGKALLAVGKQDSASRAVAALRSGIERDPDNVDAYLPLSQAYGQMGQIGDAELAAAEGHFRSGDYLNAKIFAARAQQKLKKGSPAGVRAQDIINTKDPSKRR
ncbi:MAG: tetratricopeptide repeat protein, partial [Mesorhizobium sp.]